MVLARVELRVRINTFHKGETIMKKVLALVLALVMMLAATSALADIVICQNKVVITAAMQDYA